MAERNEFYEEHVLDGLHIAPAKPRKETPIDRDEQRQRINYQLALEEPHPLDPEYFVE